MEQWFYRDLHAAMVRKGLSDQVNELTMQWWSKLAPIFAAKLSASAIAASTYVN